MNIKKVIIMKVDSVSENKKVRYSVRYIIQELKAINKLDAVRSLLDASDAGWSFIGPDCISSTNADFKTFIEILDESGVITQAEIDALLQRCILTE